MNLLPDVVVDHVMSPDDNNDNSFNSHTLDKHSFSENPDSSKSWFMENTVYSSMARQVLSFTYPMASFAVLAGTLVFTAFNSRRDKVPGINQWGRHSLSHGAKGKYAVSDFVPRTPAETDIKKRKTGRSRYEELHDQLESINSRLKKEGMLADKKDHIVKTLINIEEMGQEKPRSALSELEKTLQQWSYSRPGRLQEKFTMNRVIRSNIFFRAIRCHLRFLKQICSDKFKAHKKAIIDLVNEKSEKEVFEYIQVHFPTYNSELCLLSFLQSAQKKEENYKQIGVYRQRLGVNIRVRWVGKNNLSESELHVLIRESIEKISGFHDENIPIVKEDLERARKLAKYNDPTMASLYAMEHELYEKMGYMKTENPINRQTDAIQQAFLRHDYDSSLSMIKDFLNERQNLITNKMRNVLDGYRVSCLAALYKEKACNNSWEECNKILADGWKIGEERPSSLCKVMYVHDNIRNHDEAIRWALLLLEMIKGDKSQTANIFSALEVLAENSWHISNSQAEKLNRSMLELVGYPIEMQLFSNHWEAALFFYQLLIGVNNYQQIMEINFGAPFYFISPAQSYEMFFQSGFAIVSPEKQLSSATHTSYLVHMYRNLIRNGFFREATLMGEFFQRNTDQLKTSGFFTQADGSQRFLIQVHNQLATMYYAMGLYEESQTHISMIKSKDDNWICLLEDLCKNSLRNYAYCVERGGREPHLKLRKSTFDYLSLLYQLRRVQINGEHNLTLAEQLCLSDMLESLWWSAKKLERGCASKLSLRRRKNLCVLYVNYPTIFQSKYISGRFEGLEQMRDCNIKTMEEKIQQSGLKPLDQKDDFIRLEEYVFKGLSEE